MTEMQSDNTRCKTIVQQTTAGGSTWPGLIPAGTLRRRHFIPRGFTLIEVLVALSIATLVALVIFSVYHATSSSLASLESGRRRATDAVSAMDMLGRDLVCAIDLPFAGSVSFMLDPGVSGEAPASALAFHTVEVSSPDNESVRFKVLLVNYSLKGDEDEENAPVNVRWLVRETQQIMEDGTIGPSEIRKLAMGVNLFTVSVSDGTRWLEKWPVDGGASVPQGARIGLSYAAGRSTRHLESTVVIPAGMRFAAPAARRSQ